MGNIGCLSQIRLHLSPKPNAPKPLHTMEILAMALNRQL